MIVRKIIDNVNLTESISDEILDEFSKRFQSSYNRTTRDGINIVDFKFNDKNNLNNAIKFIEGSLPSVHSDNTLLLELEDTDSNKDVLKQLMEEGK